MKKIRNIHIYKYILYSDEIRDKESLLKYADIITDIYSEYAPHTTVIIKPHYFLVIGKLTRSHSFQVGKAFAKEGKAIKELYTVVRGISRLFKCSEKIVLKESELKNIYYIYDGREAYDNAE